MEEPLAYLNGKIVLLKDAKVGILDLGALRGFGIYEGITAFNGEPFHYADHWKRFENSARALGLSIPFSKEDILKAIRALAAHNAPSMRANIRMVLTGGEALGGLEHVPGRETLFMTLEPAVALPEILYTKGGSLITYEHQRFLPEIKTVNYITAVILQPRRKASGAIEILFTNEGSVLECATSNVFIVKDGAVITPNENILDGITRRVALELARAKHPCEERRVTTDEFFAADEVFITSSFKDIVPIVMTDGKKIGSGVPGPVTQDLMKRFAQYTRR